MQINIMLAPLEAGRLFTSQSWSAEVDTCEDVPNAHRYSKLSATGPDREKALAEIKRQIRGLGYRGRLNHFVDTWRHF